MVIRPAVAFRVGGMGLVVIVESEDGVPAVVPGKNIVSVAIGALGKLVEEFETRRDIGVMLR